MLRYSFGLNEAALAIEQAISKAIESGLRTPDIYSASEPNSRKVGTQEMGDGIAAML